MTRLTALLLFKIAISMVTIVIPFLMLPHDMIAQVMGTEGATPSLYRLYGMAVLALLVGYASAIPQAQRGELPTGIVLMGLVSNTGGAAIPLILGAEGAALYLSLVFGAIAVLLAITLISPQTMLRTLAGHKKGHA